MKIAKTVRGVIRAIYLLSPYAWADSLLKQREQRYAAETPEWGRWRDRRLVLSERYIGYWFFASILLWLTSPWLSAWIAVPLFLRVVGILNKEMGVILFGICKITEGTAVSATGRVIVLALLNYSTALFLMAAIYGMTGAFTDLPPYAADDPLAAAGLHAMQIHFSLGSDFMPADLATASLSAFHSGYCFLFGTLVISLFVSLLSVKPLKA